MTDPKASETVTDLDKFETRHTTSVPTIRTDSPMDVIMVAIEKGYDPAFIEKMMDLSDRHEKNEARKSYVRAMAAFKANPPKILKDSHVEYKGTKYDHASLGNVTETISQALSQNDLTAAWETDQGDNRITVTCHITHIAGHSESTTLSAGADTSGSKNAIQAIGSTITYLQRYTLLAITGLAAMGQDDDGKDSEPTEPKPKKELVPEAKNHWANAVTAYRRDKNFKKIEEHVYISPDNKKKIIADAKNVNIGEPE